jgi:hypothetical protein
MIVGVVAGHRANEDVGMSERVKKVVPLWVFGLLVAGALAFGAQRAMAEPAFLTCNPAIYNGGTCVDDDECVTNCNTIFGGGQWEQALCNESIGCCRCLL